MLGWAREINRLYNVFGLEAIGGGEVCSTCSHTGIFAGCKREKQDTVFSNVGFTLSCNVPIFLCASLQLMQTQSTFLKPLCCKLRLVFIFQYLENIQEYSGTDTMVQNV